MDVGCLCLKADNGDLSAIHDDLMLRGGEGKSSCNKCFEQGRLVYCISMLLLINDSCLYQCCCLIAIGLMAIIGARILSARRHNRKTRITWHSFTQAQVVDINFPFVSKNHGNRHRRAKQWCPSDRKKEAVWRSTLEIWTLKGGSFHWQSKYWAKKEMTVFK